MIKIDIISGFLGAGKTTYINNMLKELRDEKIVLIENEFGDVSIDADLIKGVRIEEISSGCICCVLKENFTTTLEELIDHDIDRIIIEPTGISTLSQILSSFTQKISARCQINSITTIVDAKNFLDQMETFGGFFTDQITNARDIYLSKVDRVDEETLSEVRRSITELNSTAVIEDISGISAISFTDYQMSPERLKEVLDSLVSGRYGRILRGKGFLGNHAFNIVNGEYELAMGEERENKLTLIGNLDKEKIRELIGG